MAPYSLGRVYRPNLTVLFCWSSLGMILATGTAPAGSFKDPPRPKISVDSTFPGYRPEVLIDGKWIEKGKETTQEFGDLNRLGNGNNTWVSADRPGEHFIRLDWPRPVAIDEVEIWWSIPEWYPRAFRVERLQDGHWVGWDRDGGWFAATDRRSVLPLPTAEVRSLRILLALPGSDPRSVMAAQEIIPRRRNGPPGALVGVRNISAQAFKKMLPRPLARNLARLNEESPGAAETLVWSPAGRESAAVQLADGDLKTTAAVLQAGSGVGVRWPVEHALDGAAAFFPDQFPQEADLGLEVHDGKRWVPLTWGLKCRRLVEQKRMEWSFEPTVTPSLRMVLARSGGPWAIAELEVFRYLPESKFVWPKRLTDRNGLKQQILSANEEPSFESLALAGLSMRSARALLGLKDTLHEIGVARDGTIQSRETIRFSFGPDREHLANFPEVVRRRLIDGWRPGTLVVGRLGDLEVRQTAFVAFADGKKRLPALFIRVALKNMTNQARKTSVQAEISGNRPGVFEFRNDCLMRGREVVLLAQQPWHPGDVPGTARIDLELAPGQEQQVDFVHPQDVLAPGQDCDLLRRRNFDEMVSAFRQYWDEILAPASRFEVPEPRINHMVRAVLAQCFINGDGDIMYYGSQPSVYHDGLFGYEESFPILGLALFGFGRDARRYLDGTYLTRAFLEKAPRYTNVAYRHQQYRNGLQPHYAVSAYRLTRDAAWARRHLPLLKECAEWTITQRRTTMVLEKGQRPLHWGLLPRWAYGGDIGEVLCYPLFANLCCWRGLVDTAWLLGELGDRETAQRYNEEAQSYRQAIDRAIEGSYQKDQRPPFLPLRLYATRPDEQPDYYQLFAGCLLDIEAFAPGSKHLRWITDFLEEDNRVFCLLPRFRTGSGAGGLDALYGKGYFLARLHEDAVAEVLLAFYAYLAFNMEHDTFVSRETNALYPSDLHVRSTYGVPESSDPLPCGSAVALHLLRHMLVTEERAGAGAYSGNLLLLGAAPRAWLENGKTIRVEAAPTYFGPVSLEVHSAASSGRIEARLIPPSRNPCPKIKLRLRHPAGHPFRQVLVNGQPWKDVDIARQWIQLPGTIGSCQIEARY